MSTRAISLATEHTYAIHQPLRRHIQSDGRKAIEPILAGVMAFFRDALEGGDPLQHLPFVLRKQLQSRLRVHHVERVLRHVLRAPLLRPRILSRWMQVVLAHVVLIVHALQRVGVRRRVQHRSQRVEGRTRNAGRPRGYA